MKRPAPCPVPIHSYSDLGVRLLAICEGCWHTAELDIPDLLRRLGPDCTSRDVRRRLRCAKCDTRNPAFQVNGSPQGMMARGWG